MRPLGVPKIASYRFSCRQVPESVFKWCEFATRARHAASTSEVNETHKRPVVVRRGARVPALNIVIDGVGADPQPLGDPTAAAT